MATREATHTKRVAAGAALLDAELPSWVDEIDLDSLDMSIGSKAWNDTADNPCGCILMQLYGSYTDGKLELNIGGPEAEELGFEAMEVPLDNEYEALRGVWEELIVKRQIAKQVIPDLGGYDA